MPARAAAERSVVGAQSDSHSHDHDYRVGSPHLKHDSVRSMVERRLQDMVRATSGPDGCHVLEIGAGHGGFTDVLLASGAQVTVSEVSEASAERLSRRFTGNPDVRVIHDASGEDVLRIDEQWAAVVMISVLHHIPDYLSFVRAVADKVRPGGGFLSVQDPIWYPRRTRAAHVASRGSYFAWRAFQGELRRGLATRTRRLRGIYDDSEPSDLVEYHVMRNGVDEEAILRVLAEDFDSVDVFRYWSTQSGSGQRIGERFGRLTDFGVAATGRR